MMPQEKERSGEFKSSVALEALKGKKSLEELSEEFGVSPAEITQWKERLLQSVSEIFQPRKKNQGPDAFISSLQGEIDKLEMELDWLRKKTKTDPPA